jgi:hypothetical protein
MPGTARTAAPVAINAPEPPKTAAMPTAAPGLGDFNDFMEKSGQGGFASGGGRTGTGASSSGPITVVSPTGDNSRPETIFIPAAKGGAASMSTSAEMPSLARDIRLPQAGARSAAASSATPAATDKGISVDLKQYFDVAKADAAAVKKAMEMIKPDMEALVRNALAKLQSNQARTQYAQ